MSHFVVTGVRGLVGSRVASQLAEAGHTVSGISRIGFVTNGIKPVHHDIRRPLPDIPEAIGSTVIHCAAEIRSPLWEEHWQANVDATRNMLEWSVRHKAVRFIFLSTGAVYGERHGLANELDLPRPLGCYAHSKYLGENLCRAFGQSFSLPVAIYRLYFPYIVGQSSGVFATLAEKLRAGNPVTFNLYGSPRLTPTALEDAVQAIALSADPDFPPQTYNLCGDEVLCVGDLIFAMADALGVDPVLQTTLSEVSDVTGSNAALKSTGWAPSRSFKDYLSEMTRASGRSSAST